MKKRFGIISIMLALLILAVGCSTEPNPEETVAEFSDAMEDFDIEKMDSMISPEARESIDEIANLGDGTGDQFEDVLLEYLESNAAEINYGIKNSEVQDDKAVVNVEYEYIDAEPLFMATFEEYLTNIFKVMIDKGDIELSDEEYAEVFRTSMEEQRELVEEPTVEKMVEVDCIKIDGEWYIDDPSDELIDVFTSNMLTTVETMEDEFEDFE